MLFSLLKGGNYTFTDVLVYIAASLIVIFLTLPIHEAAHAFAADRLGDKTARYGGRLSLNPFNHLDIFGSVCILLFGFGWAKPVPVNARYFKNPKWGMALTALAGPFANLICAFVFDLIYYALAVFLAPFCPTAASYATSFCAAVSTINIGLAVFNLIPIPPLDGSRLLTALLPTRIYYKLMQYERYFFIVLIALLWVGVLDVPLYWLRSVVGNGISFLASLPFRLFY